MSPQKQIHGEVRKVIPAYLVDDQSPREPPLNGKR